MWNDCEAFHKENITLNPDYVMYSKVEWNGNITWLFFTRNWQALTYRFTDCYLLEIGKPDL